MKIKRSITIGLYGFITGAILFGGAVFAQFYLNSTDLSVQEKALVYIDEVDGVKITDVEDGANFATGEVKRFSTKIWNNALLRFAPKTEVTVKTDAKQWPRNGEILLDKGRIWINTRSSGTNLNVRAGGINLFLEPGVFDVQFEKGLLVVVVLRRSAQVSIGERRLVVPERRQMIIDTAKVERQDETIKLLRYAKLLKEYPFFAVDVDEWIEQNIKDDEIFFRNYSLQVDERVRNAGPRIAQDIDSLSFTFSRALRGAILSLTFDSDLRDERLANSIFEYFDAGVFAQSVGQKDIAKNRLATFRRMSGEISPEQRKLEASKRYDSFAHIKPNTPLFEAVILLREQMSKSTLEQIHAFFVDVLDANADGLDLDREQNVSSLVGRFASLSDTTLSTFNDPALADELFFEYLQFDDFLKRDERFLREDYLKILAVLERAYLQLLPIKEEAQEQRQFFIQAKLKKIDLIKKKLESNGIQFQEGRKSLLLLYNQIEELRPIISDKAVLEYFDTQLKSLIPVIIFLRSSSADKLQSNFSDEFESYNGRLSEAREVQELLANSSGGEKVSPFVRESLASGATAALREVGIKNVKITFPDDDYSSSILIGDALFEDVPFTAIYNLESKVFTNIVLNGESLQNPVKLENLRVVFLVKLGKLELPNNVLPSDLTEKISEKTILEKVLLVQFKEELLKADITVEEKYIGLEDLASGLVHIRLATFGKGADTLIFSFDMGLKSKQVENLVVQTIGGEVKVNESFGFDGLVQRVKQITQRAALDKSSADELKRLIDQNSGAVNEEEN